MEQTKTNKERQKIRGLSQKSRQTITLELRTENYFLTTIQNTFVKVSKSMQLKIFSL